MISCSPIQKLERYGTLALKRKNTKEFIQFSIADEKRSNIYALTHLETWEASLSALQSENGSTTSDSFLYAMSFSLSILAYHFHTVILRHPSGVFDPECGTALQLLQRLDETARQLTSESVFRGNIGESNYSVKAAGHLLHSVLDTVTAALVLEQLAQTERDSYPSLPDEVISGICTFALSLSSSAMQLLNRTCHFSKAGTKAATHDLFSTKTCSSYLKTTTQGLTTAKGEATKGTRVIDVFHLSKGMPTVLNLLCGVLRSPTKTSNSVVPDNFFSELTLFHKLCLFHEVCRNYDTLVEPDTNRPNQRDEVQYVQLQVTIATLLSSVAGNKETCLVLYYRGDDVALLQNNVKSASDYMLYSYVTSPPIEDNVQQSLKVMFSELEFRGDNRSDSLVKSMLALLCWISAGPLVFRSFCLSDSWPSFAQEQRRKVLAEFQSSRKAMRKLRGNTLSSLNTSDGTRTEDGDLDSLKDGSVGSRKGTDTVSLRSYNTDLKSMVSLESRVSLLSTFSRHSTDTYLSFISVLGPSHVPGEEKQKLLHESEDGNTNLPLILLEEITLALQSLSEFILVQDSEMGGVLDTLIWQSIEGMFSIVNGTRQVNQTVGSDITVPRVFDFSSDVRYNNGRGYEILGLLFAKVIAPHLDVSSPLQRTTRVAHPISMCLSTYEMVAPHIIDQNLVMIVKLLCSSFRFMGDTAVKRESLIMSFFLDLISRLGKNNQLSMLYDVIAPFSSKVEGKQESAVHLSEADEQTLLDIFSLEQVQQTYVESVKRSFDQEALVSHFTSIISEHQEDQPQELVHLMHVLLMTLLTLRGVLPTSVSSSNILERSTELDVLLSSLFTRRLPSSTDTMGEKEFECMSLNLWCLYECRRTTMECLQDLGSQNVKDYVEMLDLSLWNTQSHLLHLVGEIEYHRIKEWAESCNGFPSASFSSLMTEVVVNLSLQRLVLAQNVQVVLHPNASPETEADFKNDARQLSSFILHAVCGVGEKEALEVGPTKGEMERSRLNFIATISEQEWRCLAKYSRSKLFREASLFLMRNALAEHHTQHNDTGLFWVYRALRAAPSFLMRAITDVVVSVTSDDVSEFIENGSTKDSFHLITILESLEACYHGFGHIPFWPIVLSCTTDWLSSAHSYQCRNGSAEVRKSQFLSRLLLLTRLVLVTQKGIVPVLSYALNEKGNLKLAPLSSLYIEAIGVPRVLLMEVDSGSTKAEGRVHLNDWCFEEEIKKLTASLFSSEFFTLLCNLSESPDMFSIVVQVTKELYCISTEAVKRGPSTMSGFTHSLLHYLSFNTTQETIQFLVAFLEEMGDRPLWHKANSKEADQSASLADAWKGVFHAVLSLCFHPCDSATDQLQRIKAFIRLLKPLCQNTSKESSSSTPATTQDRKRSRKSDEPDAGLSFPSFWEDTAFQTVLGSFKTALIEKQFAPLLYSFGTQEKDEVSTFVFSVFVLLRKVSASKEPRKESPFPASLLYQLYRSYEEQGGTGEEPSDSFFHSTTPFTTPYLYFLIRQVSALPVLLSTITPLGDKEASSLATKFANELFDSILGRDLEECMSRAEENKDETTRQLLYNLTQACVVSLNSLLHHHHAHGVKCLRFIRKVLSLVSTSTFILTRKPAEVSCGETIWTALLSLCNRLPTPKSKRHAVKKSKSDSIGGNFPTEGGSNPELDHWMDAVWLLLGALLQLDPNEDGGLTGEEVVRIIQLLSQNLLYGNVLWTYGYIVPGLLSRLFVVLLKGRSSNVYDRRVISRFTSFLFQLTRHAESSPTREERRVNLITITAVVSNLFQTASRYTALFTSLNADLDGFSNDLLLVMKRSALPFASAPNLTFHDTSYVRKSDSSGLSLCDLSFVSVGREEGRNLLRESAFQLEEKSDFLSTANTHSIFQVE